MRKNIYAVIDVETAGKVTYPLCYDIGIVITDKKGIVYEKKSWIVKEIFYNQKLMTCAYYGNKRPLYYAMIDNGVPVLKFKEIQYKINDLLKKYNVKFLTAYNLSFDFRALKSTYEFLKLENKNSAWSFCPFFYKEYQYIDIWSLAIDTLGKQKGFINFAKKYNKLTDSKKFYKTSAEVIFQYIINNPHFEEKHIALDDCIIESQILSRCLRQKKRFVKNKIVHFPFRKMIVQD